MAWKIKVYRLHLTDCYLGVSYAWRLAADVESSGVELRPEPRHACRERLPSEHGINRSTIARRMGVPIILPTVSPQPHTHLAFEGYQFAREHGRGSDYNHRVLETFFVEGRDIGDVDVLTEVAGEVGLDRAAFGEALRTRKYREAHRPALRHACEEAGVSGVPMLVIGD